MKFEYNKEVIIDNLFEIWEAIPLSFQLENKSWYNETNKWCKDLADKIDIPLMPVVATFSCLSPQCSFKQNKLFCESYYSNFFKHTESQISKCHRINAYYGIQLDNYRQQKQQIMGFIGGRKTQAFFENILEPNDSQLVTLDRHCFKIAGFNDVVSLTIKQYDFLQDCFQEVANTLSLLPLQYQAVTWKWWRECNNKNIYD